MNRFGRYEIIEKIGQGSMGNVYKGFDPQIKREIALKVLKEDQLENEYFVKRFLKEAMAIGRLSHPNIVTIYDVGEDHQTVYIVMEFLTGKPLNEVMKTRRFTLEEALQICIKAARALHYAHEKGVVHRDVKTTNIMITGALHVTLTDFGIAHFDDPQMTNKTQAGEILGTPAFMSPEQVAGKPVDGRSDLFSLGVILFELVTGKRPFTGQNLPAVFESIMKKDPEWPLEPAHPISPELSRIINKSLCKDPAGRFQTGEEMAVALLQIIDTSGKEGAAVGLFTEPAPAPPPEQTRLFIDEASTYGQPIPTKETPLPSTTRKAYPKNFIIIGVVFLLLFFGAGGYVYYLKKGFLFSHKNLSSEVTVDHGGAASAILSFSTQPEGAQIYIDGKYFGKTPSRIRAEYGRHEVLISLDRYFDQEFQLNVDKPEITLSRRMIPDE